MSRNICLAGMMATGKTTVATLVADRLGRRLVDTDAEIVAWQKMSIPEIFARHGHDGFRSMEASVVRELAGCHDLVMALGGGAVLRGDNVDVLRLSSVLVVLDAEVDVLVERVLADGPIRPLLMVDGKAPTRETLTARIAITRQERLERYRQVADLIVDADRSPEAVADTIVAWAAAQGDVLTPSEHEQVM